MKKTRMGILAIALALLIAPAALAEGGDQTIGQWIDSAAQTAQGWVQPTGELQAQATASKFVMPDTATIRLGARVDSMDQREAQAQTSSIMNAVTEGLKAMGIEDRKISTAGFSISQRYEYPASSGGNTRTFAGYTASMTLRVIVEDFDRIGEIIDMAVEKGANEIGDLAFSHSQEGEIYREALADAIRTARVKADAMADAAGVEIRALLTLTEGGGVSPYANSYGVMASEAAMDAGATNIMAGEIEISASVSAVYAVK